MKYRLVNAAEDHPPRREIRLRGRENLFDTIEEARAWAALLESERPSHRWGDNAVGIEEVQGAGN